MFKKIKEWLFLTETKYVESVLILEEPKRKVEVVKKASKKSPVKKAPVKKAPAKKTVKKSKPKKK